MDARAILRAEVARRERIRAAILDVYEITGDTRHAVLQSEVVACVLPVIGRDAAAFPAWNLVRQVVRALGGEVIRPRNRAAFRKVRARGMTEQEALEHARWIRGPRRP